MTFTTVVRCPRTGRLGVGMATRAPAVGNRCPVVVPMFGAASVQLIADPRLTQLCGRLIQTGYSASRVLAELQASDKHIVRRQIGIVDSYGNTAAYSGPTQGSYSGHVEGKQWVAMGNAVVSEAVVKAMAEALEKSESEEIWDRPHLPRNHHVHFFDLPHDVVWGATGRLLYDLITLVIGTGPRPG